MFLPSTPPPALFSAGRFVTRASLPLSQKPLVTSWREWISISFTLRIVSGFVLLIHSCLPLYPCLCPYPPFNPNCLSLPYLTFPLRPTPFARSLPGALLAFNWHRSKAECPFPWQQYQGAVDYHRQGHCISLSSICLQDRL